MFDLFYVLSVLLVVSTVFGIVGFVCERVFDKE